MQCGGLRCLHSQGGLPSNMTSREGGPHQKKSACRLIKSLGSGGMREKGKQNFQVNMDTPWLAIICFNFPSFCIVEPCETKNYCFTLLYVRRVYVYMYTRLVYSTWWLTCSTALQYMTLFLLINLEVWSDFWGCCFRCFDSFSHLLLQIVRRVSLKMMEVRWCMKC